MSELSRRQFIGSIAAAAVIAPLPTLSLTWQLGSGHSTTYALRAVHQQQVFIDSGGHADRYTPPQGNHSTRSYRAALSNEEFLRRHWFS